MNATMNNEVNLSRLRNEINSASAVCKVVKRDAIEYVGRLDDDSDTVAPYEGYGNNVYRIEGKEMLVNDRVSNQLDKLIHLTKKQAEIVKSASGSTGLRDFRNYLATANSVANPTSVVLIANPYTKTVSGAMPLKEQDQIITADTFFNFTELFLEKNKLYPVRYEESGDISMGITLFLNSLTPYIRPIAQGKEFAQEDFLINSYYLKWNMGKIELGRYYERLICSNGAIQTLCDSMDETSSIFDEKIHRIMDIPQNSSLLCKDFEKMSGKAIEAIHSRCSIAELYKVYQLLNKFSLRKDDISSIAPYDEELLLYKDAGYVCNSERMTTLKASMSVWDLYNRITNFASNNTKWDLTDNRRGMIQMEAHNFLMRKRDIIEYADIF